MERSLVARITSTRPEEVNSGCSIAILRTGLMGERPVLSVRGIGTSLTSSSTTTKFMSLVRPTTPPGQTTASRTFKCWEIGRRRKENTTRPNRS